MNKHFLLTLVVMVITSATNIYAQKFGLVAGLNLADMHATDDDNYGSGTSLKAGFHVGPTIEFPINRTFSFASGLILSTKGLKYDMTEDFMGSPVTAKMTVNMYYLDIPLTAKAVHDVGNVKLYWTFGPYCAIGIAGKTKATVSFLGESESFSENLPWGEDGLSRLDIGLTAGTGISIQKISLGLSYQYGFMNDLQNRLLAFSVGYQFGDSRHRRY